MRRRMIAVALTGLFGTLLMTSDAEACGKKKRCGGGHHRGRTVSYSGGGFAYGGCGGYAYGGGHGYAYGGGPGYGAPAPGGYPSGQMAPPPGPMMGGPPGPMGGY